MKFIVDENVSYAVIEKLKSLGFEVIAIADKKYSGIKIKSP